LIFELGDDLFAVDADGIMERETAQCINMLAQTRPLGEYALRVKLDTVTFQTTRRPSMVNERRMAEGKAKPVATTDE
jgi:hypothetical protein